MSNHLNRKLIHRRLMALGAVIASIVATGTAEADNVKSKTAAQANVSPPFVSTAVDRPWTIRLDLGFPYPPSGFAGLTLGYTIRGRVAIEYSSGTFGKAWSNGIMVRPRIHLTPESSLFGGGGASFALFFGSDQRSDYLFADAEVGYEFRSAGRLRVTFLVALGTYYMIARYDDPPHVDPYAFTNPVMLPYGRIGFGWTG